MEELITKNLKVGDGISIVLDIELEKSSRDSRRIVYGCASDESLDLDEQKISTSAIQKSLNYFLKYGKFDYDHKGKTGPEWIIGQPLKAEIKNKQFFVKGELFKGIKAADDVWRLMKNGAKMGMSVFGKILEMKREFDKSLGREVEKITKLILTGISITPHPINYNTYVQPWAEVAKSLSKDLGDVDDTVIEKAIETNKSGKPLIGQSLDDKIHKTSYGDDKKSKNRRNKSMKKDLESGLETLNKGMEDLKDGIDDLEKAISRYDTDDEDEDTKKAKKLDESESESQEKDTEGEDEDNESRESGKRSRERRGSDDDDDEEEDLDEDDENEKEDDGEDEDEDDDDDEDEEEGASKKSSSEHKDTGDDEDENCSKPAKKTGKPATEKSVESMLGVINKKLDKTRRIEKSLISQNETLLEVNKKQIKLIKSLSERIDDLEHTPVRDRKSVASFSLKKSAAEAINDAINGEQPDMKSLRQQVTEGKIPAMDVIKLELNQA